MGMQAQASASVKAFMDMQAHTHTQAHTYASTSGNRSGNCRQPQGFGFSQQIALALRTAIFKAMIDGQAPSSVSCAILPVLNQLYVIPW